MPASLDAVRATDAYRAQLLAVRQRLVVSLAAYWRVVDLTGTRLDRSFESWLQAASLTLAAAQRQGVALTGAYLARYLSAELGEPTTPKTPPSADQLAGVSADGRPVRESLFPAVLTVKMALGQRRPPQQALQMGLHRAARTAVVDFQAAPRRALDEATVADDRFAGWRRVASPGACGACLAAATGAVHAPRETLTVHGSCRCTKEPAVRGVTDTVRRPTGRELFDRMTPAEQDALFGGRGGAEKAELIRTGQVPFDRLIHRSTFATGEDWITEAPLEALTP